MPSAATSTTLWSGVEIDVRLKNTLAAAAFVGLSIIAAHVTAQATPAASTPQAQGGGRGQGGRGGATFPAQQRPPGDPALIERGRTIYSLTCTACHGADLRGGQLNGPNLLRSQLVLNDQEGESILPIVQGARAQKGMPAIPLPPEDVKAVAAFIHSVLASAQRQGAPPPSEAPPPDVLVGDATAGQTYFTAKCASCHSTTGDLQGIGARFPDAKTLQNFWVSGGNPGGRSGGRSGGSNGRTIMATVTLPSGEKVEGRLVRYDDFLVTLADADVSQRTFKRHGDLPRLEIRDPLQPHRELLAIYTDKDIHDVTAYLATVK
jgi:cytochrome c oxidase cbb3-type subunit III